MAVLTVGDGSWLYNPVLPGLMASAEHGLPVLVVIFNNGSYASMKNNHLRSLPGGRRRPQRLPPASTCPPSPTPRPWPAPRGRPGSPSVPPSSSHPRWKKR